MKQFVFCSFFLLLSLTLTGQTLISSMKDTVQIEEIRTVDFTALKIPERTSLLALPTTLVAKNELEALSFFTPADALQRKAGIWLTRDGIWPTSVNIRGMSKERILMLADGERIQAGTDMAGALSTIDLNSIERIEVIKGAASVLYGTGAMGGVVNFVTERPAYTPGFEVHGRAGTGFNTVNKLWASHAKIHVSENNWYLAANGTYRTAQDTKTPGGTLENSQFEDWSFGIQGGMTYDDSQEFLINYQRYEANNVGISGGDFDNDAKVRYREITRNLLSGEYIFYEPVSSLNKFSIKAYTQNVSSEVESYVEAEAQSLTTLPTNTNTTSGAKLLTDWYLRSSYHSLIVGAEGWQRKAETTRHKIEKMEDGIYKVRGEQITPDAKVLNLGVFAQYSWKIHPRKLTLDAGARFDYVRTKNDTAYDPVFTSIIQNGRETIDNDITRAVLFEAGTANELSYAAHIDLVYKPLRKHKFVLSLSNAYRTASLEERFIHERTGRLLQIGNPDLKPEQGGFSNLSYQFSGKKFNFKADIFANYLFDLITYKQGQYNGVTAFVNTNVDKALFVGGEIEAVYWINANFWATANAGYTHARDVKNDEYLPEIPPLKGMAELNYRLRNAFTASVSANWAAKQWEAVKGETQTDAYVVFNAAIRSGELKLKPVYLQFFAGMDNIFDTAYYNHLRTTRNAYAQEEPGRNIYAKVQIAW